MQSQMSNLSALQGSQRWLRVGGYASGCPQQDRVLAAILVSLFLAWSVTGAETDEPVSIEPGNMPARPTEIRLTRNPSNALVIKGDGQKYRWIRFIDVPPPVTINASGQLEGYRNDEPIQPGKWYQFKKQLPLTVALDSSPGEAYTIKLEFATLKADIKPPENPEEAREYGEKESNLEVPSAAYVKLVDDTQPVLEVIPSQIAFDRSSGSATGTGEQILELKAHSPDDLPGWVFVRFKDFDKDIQIFVAPETDSSTITASPKDQLFGGHYYGFTGVLRLTLRKPSFVNDQPITLTLEPGTATPIIERRDQAQDAISNGGVKRKGPSIKVKVFPDSDQFSVMSNILIVLFVSIAAVVMILFAYAYVRVNRTSRVRERGSSDASYSSSKAEPTLDYDGSPTVARESGHPVTVVGTRRDQSRLTHFIDSLPFVRRSPPSETPGSGPAIQQREQMEEERLRDQQALASIQPRDRAPAAATRPQPPSEAIGPDSTKLGRSHEASKRLAEDLGLTPKAEQAVKEIIKPLAEKMTDLGRKVEDLTTALHTRNETIRMKIEALDAAMALQEAAVKASIEAQVQPLFDLLTGHIESTRDILEQRVKSVEQLFKERIEERKVSDAFYTQVFGAIIKHSVQSLRGDGSSDYVREAAVNLNDFFQRQIPRPEAIADLVPKAASINEAAKAVFDSATSLNPSAEERLKAHVRNALRISEELTALHKQLTSRELTLEAQLRPHSDATEPVGFAVTGTGAESTVPIPVSAHTSARYSFVEELSFAIKREIDKLHDPEAYYKRQIERLKTSDVVAIADICDKEVAAAGKDSDLENALQSLFSSAGLRSIVPRLKEPFQAAEQNLIQIIPGGGQGDSQKVAKVVSRGFYYNDGTKERLLRKAGVEVYR